MALAARPRTSNPPHTAGTGAADHWYHLAWAILLIGWALRLRQYSFRRSLWGDESAVALNILHRSYAGLTRPLAVLQGAPFGWLWTEKLCVQLLGNGEYQLRLPSLVAGLLGMWWAFRLVRRHLSSPASAVALLLMAVSPSLVYYSSEVKPYGVDAAAAIGLLLVASSVDLATVRGAWLLAAASGCAVLFSFPSVYVSVALVVVPSFAAARRKDLQLLGVYATGAVLWLGLFGIEYVRALRPTADNPAVKNFWRDGYAPRPLSAAALLRWLGHEGFAVGRYPIDASLPILALLLLIAGLVALRRQRDGWLTAEVLVILACTIAGAVASVYPMEDRMVLFAVPLVLVAAAASVDLPRPGWARAVAAVAVVATWAGTLPRAFDALGQPYNRTEFRAALVYAHEHAGPGEEVWMETLAASVYDYYGPLLHIPIQASFEFDPAACGGPAPALATLKPRTKLWLVFGVPPGIPFDINSYLDDFKAVGPLELWRPTSAGAGVAAFAVGPKVPRQIRSPRGCLAVSPVPSSG